MPASALTAPGCRSAASVRAGFRHTQAAIRGNLCAAGDTVQHTSAGLAYDRAGTNVTPCTNGWDTTRW